MHDHKQASNVLHGSSMCLQATAKIQEVKDEKKNSGSTGCAGNDLHALGLQVVILLQVACVSDIRH